MKPEVEQDEMFPEGANSSTWETEEVSSAGGAQIFGSEKAVHTDFYNDFDDLFDDEDLE